MFGMARQIAIILLVNPTLAELTIYTIIASLTFTAVSLVLALILATCHRSCLVIGDLV